VCGTLAAIGTREANRALKRAAASGRYGRGPKDLQYLVRKRLHEAETRAKMAEIEARRLAKLAAPKSSKPTKPVAKKPATRKPITKEPGGSSRGG